jgi:hypothetical protein
MKAIICDICKQAIQDPVAGRNYFHVAHRDICESCHDDLELFLKPIIRTKQPFNYEWFDRLTQDTIERSMETGKVELPQY